MSALTGETDLVISGADLAPFSARGVSQSYSPDNAAAKIRRTVNRKAVALRFGTEDKLRTSVSCDDMAAFAADRIYIGKAVDVDFAIDMDAHVPAGETSVTLSRTPVPGSVHARDEDGIPVAVTVVGKVVTFAAQPSAVFVGYRPRMPMLIESWKIDGRPWEAATGWNMELVEE